MAGPKPAPADDLGRGIPEYPLNVWTDVRHDIVDVAAKEHDRAHVDELPQEGVHRSPLPEAGRRGLRMTPSSLRGPTMGFRRFVQTLLVRGGLSTACVK